MARTSKNILLFLLLLFPLSLLQAQSTTNLSKDYGWLSERYYYQVTLPTVRWPLESGDTLYLGHGHRITEEDSVGQELPLICLRSNNQLTWIRYIDIGIKKLGHILEVKELDGKLVVAAEGQGEKVFILEIEPDGVIHSVVGLNVNEIKGWGQNPATLARGKKEVGTWLFPGWTVFRDDEDATVLTRDGTMAWNGSFPDLKYEYDLFHPSPNGNLHLIGNSRSTPQLDWYQFYPDGKITRGLYAPSREDWSTGFLKRRKRYKGLYDRADMATQHRFFPLDEGKNGYLVISYTHYSARMFKNRYHGHTLIRTDEAGNMLWTRRYNWKPDLIIEDVKKYRLGWEIHTYKGNVYYLGEDGFYIEATISTRETMGLKDKKLEEYDALDQTDFKLVESKAAGTPGAYLMKAEIWAVDTPSFTYRPEPEYSSSKTSGRSYSTRPRLFRKGPLYKAASKAFRATGRFLRRLGRRRR